LLVVNQCLNIQIDDITIEGKSTVEMLTVGFNRMIVGFSQYSYRFWAVVNKSNAG